MKKLTTIKSAILISIILIFTLVSCGSDGSKKQKIITIDSIGTVIQNCYGYYSDGTIAPIEDIIFEDRNGIPVFLNPNSMFFFQKNDIVIIEDIEGLYIKVRKVDEAQGYWIVRFFFELD